MKNRKKLAKGVFALSMVLGLGGVILALYARGGGEWGWGATYF